MFCVFFQLLLLPDFCLLCCSACHKNPGGDISVTKSATGDLIVSKQPDFLGLFRSFQIYFLLSRQQGVLECEYVHVFCAQPNSQISKHLADECLKGKKKQNQVGSKSRHPEVVGPGASRLLVNIIQ